MAFHPNDLLPSRERVLGSTNIPETRLARDIIEAPCPLPSHHLTHRPSLYRGPRLTSPHPPSPIPSHPPSLLSGVCICIFAAFRNYKQVSRRVTPLLQTLSGNPLQESALSSKHRQKSKHDTGKTSKMSVYDNFV